MNGDKPPHDESPAGKKPEGTGARIIDTPIRRPPAGGLTGLTLRRLTPEPGPETPASVTRLRFEAPQRPERPQRLFETLRVIDLARFRQSLRRHKTIIEKKGGDYALAAPPRAALLVLLDARYQGSATRWPDVVVIRRPETGVIETNFAILGDTIYLGAHLSPDWAEGRESDRFYTTLHEALLEQARMRQSHFEPVRPKPGTDADTQG